MVDFRMKPLLLRGVRVLYKKSEFHIDNYDWFDSSSTYIIEVSDRKEPLEFSIDEMIEFLNTITRKDGIIIPKFNEDATKIEKHKKKVVPVIQIDEEEETEEIPEIQKEIIEAPDNKENLCISKAR